MPSPERIIIPAECANARFNAVVKPAGERPNDLLAISVPRLIRHRMSTT